MAVLGIETSCDETGVALYDPKRGIIAEALASQAALHAEHGGVVPEIASRDHVAKLAPMLRQVLAEADLGWADVDLLAYTAGPGLVGALMVGACVGAGAGLGARLPTLGIHHMEAHLLAPQMGAGGPAFPFVALLVSGGHTLLVDAAGVGRYRILGETLDDAAGEAFDKVARLLDLPYPGGPPIAALAESGEPDRFAFPRPLARSADLNFSFSGLKTAVRLVVDRCRAEDRLETERAHIAASFQAAAVDSLTGKVLAAIEQTGYSVVVMAGGVAANQALRQRLDDEATSAGFQIYYPPMALCTDNGAMVAYTGWRRRADAKAGLPTVIARPRWSLEELKPPGV
jgi:N6-L-threonylcarbamoyladenine synthase